MLSAKAIADRVEERGEKNNDSFKDILDQFWEDYFSLLDPAGVAERLEEEREFEEEPEGLEVNWLGQIFVFQRPRFAEMIIGLPENIRAELERLAADHEPSMHTEQMSKHQFEGMHFSAAQVGYAWQYEISEPENTEGSFLVALLRALRRAVRST